MRILSNYDQIRLILVFKKRKWLFGITLVVCMILGSVLVHMQKNSPQNTTPFDSPIQSIEPQMSFFKVQKYRELSLSKDIIQNTLQHFFNEDIITDFRLYAQGGLFDVYMISYADTNPLAEILNTLNEHPITQLTLLNIKTLLPTLENDMKHYAQFIIQNGFFESLDNSLPFDTHKNRPINKHYIYLDKNRIASEKGYAIRSTEVIKSHQSLNSKKIWIFMLIASVMISIFVIFGVESFVKLRRKLKQNS